MVEVVLCNDGIGEEKLNLFESFEWERWQLKMVVVGEGDAEVVLAQRRDRGLQVVALLS